MEQTGIKENLRAYLLLLPFLVIFLGFLAYPIIYSVRLSFHEVTDLYNVFGGLKPVGLSHYAKILSDKEFWWGVLMTFYYALLTIPTGIIVSLFLAVLLNQKLKGSSIYRSAFFVPFVLDTFVVGIVWTFIYSAPYGILPNLLAKINEKWGSVNFLALPALAMPSVAMAMVLKNAGFGMVLFLAGLQNIPESLYEAAEIDGATGLKKHLYITIPMLKPIILFMIITGIIGSLSAFAEFYGMTGGGPTINLGGNAFGATKVTGMYLYRAFESLKLGYASATSFILLVITLILSYFGMKLLGRGGR